MDITQRLQQAIDLLDHGPISIDEVKVLCHDALEVIDILRAIKTPPERFDRFFAAALQGLCASGDYHFTGNYPDTLKVTEIAEGLARIASKRSLGE